MKRTEEQVNTGLLLEMCGSMEMACPEGYEDELIDAIRSECADEMAMFAQTLVMEVPTKQLWALMTYLMFRCSPAEQQPELDRVISSGEILRMSNLAERYMHHGSPREVGVLIAHLMHRCSLVYANHLDEGVAHG